MYIKQSCKYHRSWSSSSPFFLSLSLGCRQKKSQNIITRQWVMGHVGGTPFFFVRHLTHRAETAAAKKRDLSTTLWNIVHRATILFVIVHTLTQPSLHATLAKTSRSVGLIHLKPNVLFHFRSLDGVRSFFFFVIVYTQNLAPRQVRRLFLAGPYHFTGFISTTSTFHLCWSGYCPLHLRLHSCYTITVKARSRAQWCPINRL